MTLTPEITLKATTSSARPTFTPEASETPTPTRRPPLTSVPVGSDPDSADLTATAVNGTVVAESTRVPALRAVSATPAPTMIPGTAVAEFVTPSVTVRDEFGRFLGFAEARMYAPSSMALGDTAIFRLQLIITQPLVSNSGSGSRPVLPTPSIIVPTPTLPPSAGLPQIINAYEFMGAQLRTSSANRFIISPLRQTSRLAISVGSVNYWQWAVQPIDSGALGKHIFSAYLFLPQRLSDGSELEKPVGDPFTFPIEVVTSGGNVLPTDNGGIPAALILIPLIVGVVVIGGAGLTLYRRNQRRTAFISYRRAVSSQLAQIIAEKLKDQGIDAFFDTREVSAAGRFPDRLLKAIADADVFIALVGDTTFDSEWCRNEIEHAAKLGKVMIPIFQESYKPPAEPVPAAVKTLLNYDGLPILDIRNVYIDETIQQLAEMIKKIKKVKRAS